LIHWALAQNNLTHIAGFYQKYGKKLFITIELSTILIELKTLQTENQPYMISDFILVQM
jgi:hypothetical protein